MRPRSRSPGLDRRAYRSRSIERAPLRIEGLDQRRLGPAGRGQDQRLPVPAQNVPGENNARNRRLKAERKERKRVAAEEGGQVQRPLQGLETEVDPPRLQGEGAATVPVVAASPTRAGRSMFPNMPANYVAPRADVGATPELQPIMYENRMVLIRKGKGKEYEPQPDRVYDFSGGTEDDTGIEGQVEAYFESRYEIEIEDEAPTQDTPHEQAALVVERRLGEERAEDQVLHTLGDGGLGDEAAAAARQEPAQGVRTRDVIQVEKKTKDLSITDPEVP